MIMKRRYRKWTKEEKERIILDFQKLGVTAGCRKYDIAATVYYDWLEIYNAQGIEGLSGDRRTADSIEKINSSLSKENALLKEMLAERELQIRLKDELLKKRHVEWRNAGKS